MPKISIVMAYHNRKKQLEFTLQTILNSSFKDFEIIIVDDASDENNRLEKIIPNFNMDIKLVRIDQINKKHINPCIPYNIGIKKSLGEIIVLQNPEVCHIGDCLTCIANNIKDDEYISFNCYGLPNFKFNENLINIYNNSENKVLNCYNYLTKSNQQSGGWGKNKKTLINNKGGWLNHYKIHFVAYHYLSALTRNTLNKIGGGFCELYKDGFCFDDNDFIKTLTYHKITFKIPEFNQTKPFCIHLYHDSSSITFNKEEKWKINQKVFNKRMDEMKLNNKVDIHGGFIMPMPILI